MLFSVCTCECMHSTNQHNSSRVRLLHTGVQVEKIRVEFQVKKGTLLHAQTTLFITELFCYARIIYTKMLPQTACAHTTFIKINKNTIYSTLFQRLRELLS